MSNRNNQHPCVQCELANAAEAFIEWFRVFEGNDIFNEIRCDQFDRLRAALAAANAQHGRAAS